MGILWMDGMKQKNVTITISWRPINHEIHNVLTGNFRIVADALGDFSYSQTVKLDAKNGMGAGGCLNDVYHRYLLTKSI